MIDITKKYKTRDGRAVTGLRAATSEDGFDSEWKLVGRIGDSADDCGYLAAWTSEGRDHFTRLDSPDDLVLADEDQDPEPGSPLITPDPLRVEYGAFVAAVELNFCQGNFAEATIDQFDAWIKSLTPSLRA